MEQLYQAHFGLKQAPFNISPDPTFLYLSESHREALAQLTYGIQARKGFVVLTGEVGTGKTTLIHALMNELGEETATALLFSMVISPADLLRYVCEEFKLIELGESRKDLHDYTVMLNEFLLGKYRAGENCALIIDEAQNLTAEVLEGIRLLSNFETSRDKLLQILLVGQPEFAVRLNAPELRQLKQRITLRHHLRALAAKECQEYISNRVKIAGGDPGVFSDGAFQALHAYSGGIPRIINILCDNALLTTFALEKKQVDFEVVGEVAEDLQIGVDLSTRSTMIRRVTEHQVSNRPLNNRREVSSGTLSSAPPADMSRRQPEKYHTGVYNASVGITVLPGGAPSLRAAASPSGPAATPRSFEILHHTKPVDLSAAEVSHRTLQTIVESLTDSMGPMASVIVREQLNKISGNAKGFPREKLTELIEVLSEEIFDVELRHNFRDTMLSHVKELV
jgi:type II secretory pathway predicted ATPase ExeA